MQGDPSYPAKPIGDADMRNMLAATRSWAGWKLIDPLESLAQQKVWLFHGYNDGIVKAPVSEALYNWYPRIRACRPGLLQERDAGCPCTDFGRLRQCRWRLPAVPDDRWQVHQQLPRRGPARAGLRCCRGRAATVLRPVATDRRQRAGRQHRRVRSAALCATGRQTGSSAQDFTCRQRLPVRSESLRRRRVLPPARGLSRLPAASRADRPRLRRTRRLQRMGRRQPHRRALPANRRRRRAAGDALQSARLLGLVGATTISAGT